MSHGTVGADVEELQRLAQQFDHAATRLQQLAGTVGNGIRISAWVGPFAVRFRHTWDSEYSVKLRQAADLLQRNAALLRAEAQQQSIASNSNGTATIPRATMPGASHGSGPLGSLADNPFVRGIAAFGPGALGVAAWLSKNPRSTGNYSAAWHRLLALTDRVGIPQDLFRFKRSPVSQFLNQYQGLLGKGATAIGVLGLIDPVQSMYFNLREGDVRNGVFDGINAGANAIPNPLYGFTAGVWGEVGRAATNPAIDWSPHGLLGIVTASPSEWGNALVEGLQSDDGLKALHNIGIPGF